MSSGTDTPTRSGRLLSWLFVAALFAAVAYFGLTSIPSAQRPTLGPSPTATTSRPSHRTPTAHHARSHRTTRTSAHSGSR